MSEEAKALIRLIIRIELANELHALFTIKDSPEYKNCLTICSVETEKLLSEIRKLNPKLNG